MTVINKGDMVTIAAQGLQVTGKVVYAWFDKDYINGGGYWDIEMKEANVPGGYSHWKQEMDGGQLLKVNGQAV